MLGGLLTFGLAALGLWHALHVRAPRRPHAAAALPRDPVDAVAREYVRGALTVE